LRLEPLPGVVVGQTHLALGRGQPIVGLPRRGDLGLDDARDEKVEGKAKLVVLEELLELDHVFRVDARPDERERSAQLSLDALP
jgi:hypothetical protein